MFAVKRVSSFVVAGGLALSGLMATAVAQSSGPSTTGGALPYVIGPQKPAAAAPDAANPPGSPAPSAQQPAATVVPPRPGVRVIDLSKREPVGPDERAPTPPTVAAPATASPVAPSPNPVADVPKVATTPSATAPALTTTAPFTPPAPQGADALAATPPSIDRPTDQPAATPATPPRALANAPAPRPKPKAKVATTNKQQPKRPSQATARLDRRAPSGDLEVYDQDVEVEIDAPRPLRAGPPRPRLAGYDAWGRPIYYMPNTPGRDRRVARAPRYLDDEWVDAPPARLRRLPPMGYLRPFPPGAFRGDRCRTVFYTDETGYTRRETRCR